MNKWLKPILAEFIGTFVLVFVGMAAVVATVANGFDVTVPALAHGLAVVGLAYTYGHISGVHINPAVTVGLLVGGQIDAVKAGAYVVAQFLGGIVAAYTLAALVPTAALTAGNFGQTVGSITAASPVQAAVFEAILTFFLVSAVYQNAAFGKSGQFAGLAIGATLMMSILAGGPFTGASLNPARTLGPALVAGDFSYLLPYFVGIFAGGIVAGLVQTYLLKSE